MICQKFEKLTPVERIRFIGSIHHAIMSDDDFFENAQYIIDEATIRGLFKGVTILPESELINIIKL